MTPDAECRIAILTSRFPKLSETFILEEVLELERTGAQIELFPLRRERTAVAHPGAARLDRSAHHLRLFSREVLGAQLWWLRHRPRRYLRVWSAGLKGNLASPAFLARALYVIPKAAAFARRIRARRLTHLHAHYATHPALAAWVAAELTGIPYSFTAHAHDIYVERTMLAEKIGGAEFVRAISERNRALLGRLYGVRAEAKTTVIHCGVDTARFTPPRNGAHRDRPFTLACVASLEEYKGHDYLLRALAQLDRAAEVRCLLVGDGELRPVLENRVRELGLAGQVVFCGPQPAERVRELLTEADAAVLASVVTDAGKMEGIPVALMEAMASGLPVVASDISGVSELVEDEVTGLLVPQRDPASLAAAIARLAGDAELRQRLGGQGRRRVRAEFELSANVARLRSAIAG